MMKQLSFTLPQDKKIKAEYKVETFVEPQAKRRLPQAVVDTKPRVSSSSLIDAVSAAVGSVFLKKHHRVPLLRFVSDAAIRLSVWQQFQFTAIVGNATIVTRQSYDDAGVMNAYNFYITLLGQQCSPNHPKTLDVIMIAQGTLKLNRTAGANIFKAADVKVEKYRIDLKNDTVYPAMAAHNNFMVFIAGYQELKYMPCIGELYANINVYKPDANVFVGGVSETQFVAAMDVKSDILVHDDFVNAKASVQYL